MPAASSNQRKEGLPTNQAKGRPSTGSLSPGACPTSITRLRTAPPLTTGRCIFGQRQHARSSSTWRVSRPKMSLIGCFARHALISSTPGRGGTRISGSRRETARGGRGVAPRKRASRSTEPPADPTIPASVAPRGGYFRRRMEEQTPSKPRPTKAMLAGSGDLNQGQVIKVSTLSITAEVHVQGECLEICRIGRRGGDAGIQEVPNPGSRAAVHLIRCFCVARAGFDGQSRRLLLALSK